jgi:TonB family protein
VSTLTQLLPFRFNLEKKPLIITAGIHVLLLLMLLLWRFSVPTPAVSYPEMGMEVNLGTSTEGSGKDQSMDIEEPAASTANAARSHQREAANDAPEIERSNRHDAPVIAETRPGRRQQEQTPRQEHRPTTQQNSGASTQPAQPQARYVYPGATGRGGNSAQGNISGTGEGITGRPGDQGVPGGTPGATNYSGTPGNGNGLGLQHSLTGRSIVAYPAKEAAFREGGQVVIRVTVNREGAIINKTVKSSTNTELNSIALRKLLEVRFNKSPNAPEEQFGTITFVFRPRQ